MEEKKRIGTLTDPMTSKIEMAEVCRKLIRESVERGSSDRGYAPGVEELIWARFDPTKQPLKAKLRKHEQDHLAKLREARMRIPGSYTVMGIADPTGTLHAGEVCALREKILSLAIGLPEDEAETVLVYKPPGCLVCSVART